MFTGTLSVEAQNALALLGKNKILPKNTFLAGGSALALQFGHRISVDFDFFTPTSFDGEELRQKLEKIGEFIFQEADKKDFIDAEKTKMPEMIEKVDWEKVKEFFRKETIRLAKKYIGI